MKGRIAYMEEVRTPLRIDEFEVPTPGEGQVLVKVLAAGVCGSDVHQWRGEQSPLTGMPAALGHEMVGQVATLGSGISTDSNGDTLSKGDRVVFAYFQPCGACQACLAGSVACTNRYSKRTALNVHDEPHFLGAFGDYYLLNRGQWIYKVPDSLATDIAVPANCAISQAFAGVDRAQIKIGDTVVVQGLGGLGLYACALAKDSGAANVIGVDLVPERLELASNFGADHLINGRELSDPAKRAEMVREISGGGGADVVIEMAGHPSVIQEGIDYLRPGGRYILIGNVLAGAEATIVPASAVRGAKEIIGVVNYHPWVLPRVIDWLNRRQDHYPFKSLVAAQFELENINDAIGASDWAGSGGAIGRAIITL